MKEGRLLQHTVLIVEDKPEDLYILNEFLNKYNFIILVARNGEELFKRMAFKLPDIILLDIMMPEINGFEICKRLKKSEKYKDIPVIFMSALTDTIDKVKGLELGAVDYITKPFNLYEVIARIRTHLELKDTQQMLRDAQESLEKRVLERTASLAASEAKYRRLVESLERDYFIYSRDVEGFFTYVSPSISSVLGYSQDEFLVSYDKYFTDNIANKKVLEYTRAAINGETVPPYELEVWHKDGRARLLKVVEKPVFDDKNRVVAVEGIAHDITLQAKLQSEMERLVQERTSELELANERLKEMDRLKSMFIASMSHELRTPLNSIIGFTGLMLQGISGNLNDIQKDNLSRVYRSGKHLLALISDVIDISKIEAGYIDIYPEWFSLKELVDEAVSTIRPQLEKKNMTLDIEADSCPEICTDRKRLLQCLVNFLSNAEKFSEEGSITIIIREVDDNVELSVRDTGLGIAKEDLPRLFDAFERLQSKLQVKAGGTGLGLYLTKKIANQLLQGTISVESTEGKGSTFTIFIPNEINDKKIS